MHIKTKLRLNKVSFFSAPPGALSDKVCTTAYPSFIYSAQSCPSGSEKIWIKCFKKTKEPPNKPSIDIAHEWERRYKFCKTKKKSNSNSLPCYIDSSRKTADGDDQQVVGLLADQQSSFAASWISAHTPWTVHANHIAGLAPFLCCHWYTSLGVWLYTGWWTSHPVRPILQSLVGIWTSLYASTAQRASDASLWSVNSSLSVKTLFSVLECHIAILETMVGSSGPAGCIQIACSALCGCESPPVWARGCCNWASPSWLNPSPSVALFSLSHCIFRYICQFPAPERRTTIHWQNDECGATQNSGCSDAGKAQKLKAPLTPFKAPDNSTLARKDFQPIPHHTSLPSPLSHLFFHCFLKFSLIPIQQQQQQQQFFNLDDGRLCSSMVRPLEERKWCCGSSGTLKRRCDAI